jgi:hypothetical protein
MHCVGCVGGCRGVGAPGFWWRIPQEFFFCEFLHLFLMVFPHMVFIDGFLIPVKELGFLTNIVQCIRGLGCCEILYILYYKKMKIDDE